MMMMNNFVIHQFFCFPPLLHLLYIYLISMYTVQEPSASLFRASPKATPPQKVTQRNKIQKHSSNIFLKKNQEKKIK